ncbi:hypothetical protein [Haloarcula nitratireducens]|uniref:Phospholipase D-like domain-containing protein n=1 Tax=Haloarcula nitratireducens TaxID=2487749 RepID=A0AAW4PI81_9EURY|nr:hypothetical protein [Halomicroarcula nitratireducens]MBX0296990.1 hypothetical protein [Halomicroarcula nitratireducens]
MRELIEEYPTTFSSGSFVSAWNLSSGNPSLLFGLLTTTDFGDITISPEDDLIITSERISETDLLKVVPEALSNQVQIELSVDLPDTGTITFDQHRQPRICRRNSQEMEGFGMEYPAFCVEYWPVGDSIPSSGLEQEIALQDSLKDNFGIDLDEHAEYLGAILAAVEDRRVRIRFNESGEKLARRLHEEVETLNDEEVLDLHDTWIVETKSGFTNELEITLREEEYGQLLNEKSVDLNGSNSISESTASEFVRTEQRVPSRLALNADSTQRYELPDIPSSGASDRILKITYDGVLLDEYSIPLVRHVNLNVNVRSGYSSAPSAETPELIFGDSDYTVGRFSWDQRLALSGGSDQENWVVEDESDYEEVMEMVHDSLSGTVKIVDPYLRPDDLTKLVAASEQDANMWVITALYSGEMQDKRQDFESTVSTARQDGKDLHISWVPDSPTPLHDRFLLSKGRSMTFGTSFNSLESNLTIVHEISEEKAAQLEKIFDYWWTNNRFKSQNNVELIDTTY